MHQFLIIKLKKKYSRHVGTVAGVILILLGKALELNNSVIGGAAIIMFGLIAGKKMQELN